MIYPRFRLRGQNFFLLVVSYVFYGYWDWRFNFLLFFSTILNFWFGQWIHGFENKKHRKLLLIISVAVNLGILGFFKYFNFFVDSAASLLSVVGFQPNLPVLRVILPVGISFYTFQTMSYTIDIYRKKIKPTKNFIDFALFVSFFPLLLAGPIQRASNLLPQISKSRQVTRENILTGLNLVLLGYFKKVAIADTLAPIVENIFSAPEGMSSGLLWTGAYAFTFQIYGDFSGYTDIARGIARMLGFELMENFNAPYLSRNMTEFWRRWHISLSTWLRDYLYIPLGGNRKGKGRTYSNIMMTMLLGGLWHGAAWNFVFWGLLHGAYLAGHRMFFRSNKLEFSWPRSLSGWTANIIKVFFTFHLVAITWVFFRSPDLHNSLAYIGGLFRFDRLTDLYPSVIFAGVLMIVLDIAQTWSSSHTWITDHPNIRIVRYSVAQLLLVSTVIAAIGHMQTIIPFIYFQF